MIIFISFRFPFRKDKFFRTKEIGLFLPSFCSQRFISKVFRLGQISLKLETGIYLAQHAARRPIFNLHVQLLRLKLEITAPTHCCDSAEHDEYYFLLLRQLFTAKAEHCNSIVMILNNISF